jgi:5,10-methylenetetrahydrofolate reductase
MMVAAEAHFFQKQAVYAVNHFAEFMDEGKDAGVQLHASILLLKSMRRGIYLNNILPGVFVPDSLVQEMESNPYTLLDARTCREIQVIAHGVDIAAMEMNERRADILKLV